MAVRRPRKSKLDPFMDKVGVLPDKMIAEMVGVKTESVRRHRHRHGIPARWRGQGEPLPNEAAILAEAGLEPPPKPKKAAKKRKANKPKAKKAPPKTRKPRAKKSEVEPVVEPVVEAAPTPEAIVEEEVAEQVSATGVQLIGEPTPEPAPAPPATTTRPGRKSKLDGFLDKVGVLPDKAVAELAGVTSENVRAYRKRRGIPAGWRAGKPKATRKAKAKRSRKPRRGKLTPFMDQLGVTPDARIAEMAGTSPANVRAFRLRHGIPARWRGEGEPLPNEEAILALHAGPPAVEEAPTVVEAPAPQTAAAPTLEGYQVAVAGEDGETLYVVVAVNLVAAAQKALDGVAERAIDGKVVGLRFMGMMLGG